MDLTPYLEQFNYHPEFTDFIFGDLAENIRQRGYMLSTELVLIYVWKNFWRENLIGAYTTKNPEEIKEVTKNIFLIDHNSADDIKKTVLSLSQLYPPSELALKLATSVLAIVFPDKYGIVDRRIQNALNIPKLDETSATEAILVMREIAKEQQTITGKHWTPRMVDMALWCLDKY
jgi:hypothetical protein